MNIRYCSVIVAELWGVYQDLMMAWDHNVCWLLVEVNSQCVVQQLNNLEEINNEYSPLVSSIKELIHRNWHISVNHIYREANFTADSIANYATDFPIGLHKLSSPPACVTHFLLHDMYGVAHPRIVSL